MCLCELVFSNWPPTPIRAPDRDLQGFSNPTNKFTTIIFVLVNVCNVCNVSLSRDRWWERGSKTWWEEKEHREERAQRGNHCTQIYAVVLVKRFYNQLGVQLFFISGEKSSEYPLCSQHVSWERGFRLPFIIKLCMVSIWGPFICPRACDPSEGPSLDETTVWWPTGRALLPSVCPVWDSSRLDALQFIIRLRYNESIVTERTKSPCCKQIFTFDTEWGGGQD